MERISSKVGGAPPPPLSGAVPPPVKVSHYKSTVPKLPQSAFLLVSENTNVISLRVFAYSYSYLLLLLRTLLGQFS